MIWRNGLLLTISAMALPVLTCADGEERASCPDVVPATPQSYGTRAQPGAFYLRSAPDGDPSASVMQPPLSGAFEDALPPSCQLPPREDLRPHCDRLCERSAACSPPIADPGCSDSCLKGFVHFREEAIAALTDCLLASGCRADESRCIRSIAPLDIHVQYGRACRDKGLACGRDLQEIETWCDVETNDWAARYRLYDARTMQSAIACLEGPCPGRCALGLPGIPLVP
jgi:hypothetical protein